MTQTILLTGITGFIAKHIAKKLLDKGFIVRGSMRNLARADEVRSALQGHPRLDQLSFVQLDLSQDAGWEDAMQGVDAVMHTASPFPMADPKDEDDLIRPAVDGTKRALNAAQKAGVTRVVLTSSMVSIMYVDRPEGHAYGPKDWTDVTHPAASAYAKSKTLAEQAAWDFVSQHPEMQLTTINPGLVTGTPLDDDFSTSLEVIVRLMSGKDPAVPNIGFPVVDVEDVAFLHVEALHRPDSIGKRVVAAVGFHAMPDIARMLKTAHPDRKIATRIAPRLMLQVLSLFDRSLRPIVPLVDRRLEPDYSATERTFEFKFVPAKDSILRSAAYIDARMK